MARLIIVPTPIGNLQDITLRALEVLRSVSLILAEDTRTSSHLLRKYEIHCPMWSHHKFNEHHSSAGIVDRILAGEDVALISDAGTPGISDPGFMLIRECIRRGIEVDCLPGPTAAIPALVMSGLPADRFVFEGFLPVKKGRITRIAGLAEESRSIIIYESPHRLHKTLLQLCEHFSPDRPAAVCRELTKVYQEVCRGTLSELCTRYEQEPAKGEIVLVIGGKDKI